MPDSPLLLIRADGGTRIGAGHIMRCLALAQAWRGRGGRVKFLASEISPSLHQRILSEKFEVAELAGQRGSLDDAAQTVEAFRIAHAAWLVCDGYEFKDEYQRAIRAEVPRLMAVDDFGQCEQVHADLVLNQNPHARESLYKNRNPETELLLGSAYALLREEFLNTPRRERSGPVKNVLVSLGGSDPENVSLRILSALTALSDPELQITLIVGGSNPHLAALKHAAESHENVQLIQDVKEMTHWMNEADFAVSNGGVTCWELACLGVPFAVVSLSEDQRLNAEALEAAGLTINLGWHEKLDIQKTAAQLKVLLSQTQRLEGLSRKGMQLIDGKGAARVVTRMLERLK